MSQGIDQSTALPDTARVFGANWLRSTRQRLVRTLTAHLPFIILVGLYLAGGVVAARLSGMSHRVSLVSYGDVIPTMTWMCLWFWMIGYPFYVMSVVQPKNLFKHIREDLVNVWLTPERLLGGLIIFALLPVVISVFSSLKMLIPEFRPFCFDTTFESLDRTLHFGVAPWRLLHPLMGWPIISCAFNFLYNIWFFVLYGILFWQAFSVSRPKLRMQFFLTFVLLWAVVGGPLAVLWSSAGPVYYQRVTGASVDPYEPLMTYLNQANESVPLWSLAVQEKLWDDYQKQGGMLGGGISAMPSMHVASAILFALVGFQVSRRLGKWLAVYAALIWLGSIHLGWHYAVDGYVSLLLTIGLWWLVGKAVRSRMWPTASGSNELAAN
ncbi:MAG: phosphatase PAP2 family protein [Planctomycetota bacterium]